MANELAPRPNTRLRRGQTSAVWRGHDSLSEQMELANESIVEMALSADAQEGVNAFLTKQPPHFSGRKTSEVHRPGYGRSQLIRSAVCCIRSS